MAGATIVYSAIDDPTLNTVTVSEAPGARCNASRCLQIADTTVEPGIDPGPCTGAGGANPHTVYCPWKAGARLRLDLGELDDSATVEAPIPADLRGGPGNDTLRGGTRNDELAGGSGVDTLEGGGGDDLFSAVDGAGDRVTCGAGLDAVDADAGDDLSGDCEDFTKVADPNAAAPVLKVSAVNGQHVGRSRAVVARVRGPGSITLAGRARGSALAPTTVPATMGAWTTVKLRLPGAAVPRGRRSVAVTLVATTADGSARATLAGLRVRR
jgi:hypothetical protein